MTWSPPGAALVVGYGLTGRAVSAWLSGHGCRVTVIEDDPAFRPPARSGDPGELVFEHCPTPVRAAELVRQAALVVPSPGVPVAHPALVAADQAATEVVSEVELAWRALAPPAQVVAITGTNGKTTVTNLVAAMLRASGRDAVEAGNVGFPLITAVDQPGRDRGSVLVVEVSSFQLHYAREFRPDVSCWLNFAPDHLDWHPDLEHYARAKARIWANQGAGSTVVVNGDDTGVMTALATWPPRGPTVPAPPYNSPALPPGSKPTAAQVVTFGTGARGAAAPAPAWAIRPDRVEGPGGIVIKAADLPRA
ncbi:MAG TPA: UDP-N-acetylmuramoyl-L-alanine--D-glutamate ligase, partial [Acidimicrobiales bacterium]|nr:UDP-N-acetylmuramoyl-L-alanine--D-glutamate ligase [Acidimicrobiales bacterium]